MSRQWGATGVGKWFPPRLSSGRRKQIVDELRGPDFPLEDPEPLLADLAAAVGHYESFRNMREKSRPAAVRANLKAALKVAEKLNDRFNDLDANSWLLINEAANLGSLSLREHLNPIITVLFGALQLAKQYPDKGNLPENERLYLAADVLDALKKHLGVSSSKALEAGHFEAVLKVVLEEAVKEQRKDLESIVRNLVDQALQADRANSIEQKIKIKHCGGKVEYRRP